MPIYTMQQKRPKTELQLFEKKKGTNKVVLMRTDIHQNDISPGLADLNQCDLNHWFQSQFKSIDLVVKKIEWFKSHWRFHLPMKNYNKQDEMYCFIDLFKLFCPLFNLFNSSTTDFSL